MNRAHKKLEVWQESVFLYYKQEDKLYCVVVRHEGVEGFLITAYPTDKVKEGEIIWTK